MGDDQPIWIRYNQDDDNEIHRYLNIFDDVAIERLKEMLPEDHTPNVTTPKAGRNFVNFTRARRNGLLETWDILNNKKQKRFTIFKCFA